jgi:hypothetical protein
MSNFETFLDKCDVIANHAALIGAPLHETPLDLVQLLRMVRETADSALPYAVANARAEGASWEKVARMLDVSKQAAQQRYGGHAPASQSSHV